MMKPSKKLVLCALLIPLLVCDAWAQRHRAPGEREVSPQYQTQPGTVLLPYRYTAPYGSNPRARLAYWCDVAWGAIALDHTPPLAGAPVGGAEQLGPTRTSRAMAIFHIALYDALNAITRRYPGYSGSLPAFSDSSQDAAIAQAAHDTLVWLYPHQAARIDAILQADLARLAPSRAKLNGIDIGRRAAAAIIALRASDGAAIDDPLVGSEYVVSLLPGQWRPDPISRIRTALGAHWRQVRPFVMQSASMFRAAPPPAMQSDAYTAAFNEVRQLGGDGVITPSRRTREETAIGIFWSYDGTAWIGTPSRLYNQIAMQLAHRRSTDPLELARALALVNVAMADATIAVWETKYYYDFWRPVTAIREASPGTSPTGAGDGNPATRADPGWMPLGAPASNLTGPNFTPPFPAYVSGHAGQGSAAFQTLRHLYGDNIAFTFVSDEYNGITRDNTGRVRPRMPRAFTSLTQAELENAQSRIYLGVHWQFDKVQGMRTGRSVADYVIRRGLVRPPL